MKKIMAILIALAILPLLSCDGPKTYCVVFKNHLGKTLFTQRVFEGECAEDPNYTYIEAGQYSYSGWKLNGEFYSFSTPIIESIELFPAINYIVAFKNHLGELLLIQEVPEGECAKQPNNVYSRTSEYSYSGWKLNGEFYSFSTPVNQPIELITGIAYWVGVYDTEGNILECGYENEGETFYFNSIYSGEYFDYYDFTDEGGKLLPIDENGLIYSENLSKNTKIYATSKSKNHGNGPYRINFYLDGNLIDYYYAHADKTYYIDDFGFDFTGYVYKGIKESANIIRWTREFRCTGDADVVFDVIKVRGIGLYLNIHTHEEYGWDEIPGVVLGTSDEGFFSLNEGIYALPGMQKLNLTQLDEIKIEDTSIVRYNKGSYHFTPVSPGTTMVTVSCCGYSTTFKIKVIEGTTLYKFINRYTLEVSE